jgi:hypothetical protein
MDQSYVYKLWYSKIEIREKKKLLKKGKLELEGGGDPAEPVAPSDRSLFSKALPLTPLPPAQACCLVCFCFVTGK